MSVSPSSWLLKATWKELVYREQSDGWELTDDDSFTRYAELLQVANAPLFCTWLINPTDYSPAALQELTKPAPIRSFSDFCSDHLGAVISDETSEARESFKWSVGGGLTAGALSLINARNPLTLVVALGIGLGVGYHAHETSLWYANPNYYTHKSRKQ